MSDHRTSRPALCALACAASVVPAGARAADTATMVLEVDVTDLSRNLARAVMEIRAQPGPLELQYTMWPPGNHAPSGPIENVVDLVITDCAGNVVEWVRHPTEVSRLALDVPEGCSSIRVDLAYIASQPNTLSRSTDTYGRPTFGGLNWNSVLFYPVGPTHQEIIVDASLGLPAHWKYATSLEPVAPVDDGRFTTLRDLNPNKRVNWIEFEPVPLAELVDSPVAMGEHLRTYELEVPGIAPHYMTLVADDPALVILPDWLKTKFEEMVRQGVAIFSEPGDQRFPREEFYFLWLLGDGLRFGVEHGESTYIGSNARRVASARESAGKGGGASLGVVPHEYFHAWCGKLAAPAGLVQDNFHTPVQSELLWVYEGLTSYYDNVLSARSGLTTLDEYKSSLLGSVVTYEQRAGRLWRSIADTARAAQKLRGRSLYWYSLRQGQEYYGQGAMFWLEADALIREGTGNRRSLDDFCRILFDVPSLPVGSQATYTRSDVIDALTSVYEGIDWDALVIERIERPQESLDMGFLLELAGYRLVYSDEPTSAQRTEIAGADDADVRTSLGLVVDDEAKVSDIIPGSPADSAGIAFGMEVLAVDGRVYTPERLRRAIDHTPATGGLALTVRFGPTIETIRLAYDQGPRHPRLERIESATDHLEAITAPIEFAPGSIVRP